ncbi:MAG: 3-deoxy-7-phosphoheptulonate synthase [Planctomycetota bacterium]|nr:MAG: 3-deoxy-7-phosphoheptulonate synthase [Planctomycetota bacterium]
MSLISENADDIHIDKMIALQTPLELKEKYPLTDELRDTVIKCRKDVNNVINRDDNRFMIITGPCSIHDEKVAEDYAKRLKDLSDEVSDKILLVMRVYFEKPRTTVGWKGLISDPHINGVNDIDYGLELARKLLVEVVKCGLPVATEALDPVTPQYIGDLISWIAIGARTTESQTHRELASGVSAAVGFKNGTSGNLDVALNAMVSSSYPHNFLGIDQTGQTKIVRTLGNKLGHLVLRGGDNGPNYDKESIASAEENLRKRELKESIIVDCSHANSSKDHNKQLAVMENLVEQIIDGNKSIIGAMLESNINEGNQPITDNVADLAYGVSITDKCINWESTETLIKNVYKKLKSI